MVFLVLYVDYIFDSWKQYQGVIGSKGMVVQAICYKGLRKISTYSWEQGSQEKNVVLISSFI